MRAGAAPTITYNDGVELASRCFPLPADDRPDPVDIECEPGRPQGTLQSQVNPANLVRAQPHAGERVYQRIGDPAATSAPGPFNSRRRPTMPTTTLPVADDGRPSGEPVDGQRESAIGAGVLAALGRLGQLYRVAVVPLWGTATG